MSREIEQKVVEMRFDNEQFEKNAQQSLSTLEKLKNALSFKGAKDGLKGIDEATRNVNMTGLANSVDTVSARFSALQVIGITALANITNRAVDAGMALVRNLSVDQVSAGWSKYAEKTTAVQTIMAATANAFSDTETQMAAVNEQLEKLSWFTDETSYNFVDMVSNIGKFTSNNISLEESVTSMQGIATWAAISGANATEASRAMYNLSQAIGVGAVTAVDWRSIENANMATAEFKQTVIDMAAELGTLKKNADGTFETLSGKAVSVANFREELSEKWFTNDVLTKALDKYGSFTTKLNEAYNETGKLTSEILDDIADYKKGVGDYANITENASASSKRYAEILKELSSEQYDFGRKAFQAAQETKTFSEVIDYTKDAVSSQWMGIFEAMFGDYANAKKLWTGMSEDFYTLFVEPLENVRGIVENAFGSKWDVLTEKITGAGLSMSDLEDNLRSMGNLGNKTLDELIEEYGSLEAAIASGQISRGVIRDAIEKTIDKALKMGAATEEVTKSVVNLEDVVKRVIRGEFGNGQARIEALTKAGYDYAIVQDMVNKTLWNQAVDYNIVSESQLKSIGYTDEQIEKIKELQKEARTTGSDLNELLKQIQKPSGRQLFTESLQNSLQIIIRSIQLVKNSWASVFNGDASSTLYRVLEAIHGFTENTLSRLDKNSEKISRTFKGLFNVLDLAARLLKGAFRTGVKLVNKVLSRFNMNIWDVTAAIGDWLTHIHDVILGNAEMSGTLDTVIGAIARVIAAMIHFLKQIGLTDKAKSVFDKLATKIKSFYDTASNFFKDVGANVEEFIKRWEKLDHIDLSALGAMLQDFKKTVIDPMWKSLMPSEESVAVHVSTFFGDVLSKIKLKTSVENSPFVASLVDGLKKAKDYIVNNVGLEDIFTGIIVGADLWTAKKLIGLIGNFSDLSDVLVSAVKSIGGAFGSIKKYFTSLRTAINVKIITNIAIAIAILVASLVALAYIPVDNLDAALWRMTWLAGILVALAAAVGLMNKLSAGASGLNALGLLGVAASFLILTRVVKIIAACTPYELKSARKTLWAMGGLLVSMFAAFALITKLTKVGPKTMLGMFGLVGAALAMKILIGAIADMSVKLDGLSIAKLEKQLSLLFDVLFWITMFSLPYTLGSGFGAFGMLGAALSIVILIKALEKIADFDVTAIKNNMDALITIMGTFAVVMLISRAAGENAAKGGAMILQMAVALLIIVEAIKLMSDINNRDLTRGVVALGIMMIIMGIVVKMTQSAGQYAAKAGVTLILMAAAIAILVASMYLLTIIAKDKETFNRALTAIIAMGAIMVAILAVAKYGKAGASTIGLIAVLVAVVVSLAGAIYMLSKIDVKSLTVATAAMGGLMAMFALMEFAAKFAGSGPQAIAGMAMLLGVVLVLALILGTMAGYDLENVIQDAVALGTLMVAFSASMLMMSKIGPLAAGAMSGIASMATALILISGVLVTIGGLIGQSEKAMAFVTNAKSGLSAVGEAIGSFFGSIASGFSESFVTVGKNLRAGLDEIIPAMEQLASIENASQIFDGIAAISGMAKAFGGAELKDAFSNLINAIPFVKKSGADSFGDKLKDFVSIFEDFPVVDKTAIDSAKNVAEAGKALADFASAVPNEGGILADIFGDNKLLGVFGARVAAFAESVSGIEFTEDDGKALGYLADAGSALAKFGNDVGNEGGTWAKFFGDNANLGGFGLQVKSFAKAVTGIEFSEDDKTSLGYLAEAGTAIADFAKKVGNVSVEGTENGSTYGLGTLGSEMKAFAGGITGIKLTEPDVAAINLLPSAFDALSLIGDSLYQNQMVFNALFEDQTLANFIDGIAATLPNLADLDTSLMAVDFPTIAANIAELSSVLESLLNIIKSITGDEGSLLSQLTKAFKDFASNGIKAFEQSFADSVDSDGVVTAVEGLVDKAVKAVSSDSKQKDFSNAGKTLIKKLQSGVDDYDNSTFSNAFTSKLSDSVKAIEGWYLSFYNAGKFLIQGYIAGINALVDDNSVHNAGYRAGQSAHQGIMDGQKSDSPSKLAMQAGRYLGEGYVIGISEYFSEAATTGEYLAENGLTAIANTLANAKSIVGDNMDIHPTISPVVDRTAIAGELNAIGTMFSQSKASVLSANISGQMDANNVVLDYISKLDAANSSRSKSVLDKFDKLSDDILTLGDRIEALELTLDGDKLVGGIVKRTDRALGTRTILEKRGL